MPITKEQLEKRAASVRMGGKGTMRRPAKSSHKPSVSAGDDKKVRETLKKLGVTPVNEITEALFLRNDGSAFVFKNPSVQASMQSQCFVVSGHYETKTMQDLLPEMIPQLANAAAAAQQ